MINITVTPPAADIPAAEDIPAPPSADRLAGNLNHRNDALLAFEAEFDTFVTGTESWGPDDQYFIHDGYAYYYKPRLDELIVRETRDFESEASQTFANYFPEYVRINRPTSIDAIRTLIQSNPPGLPKVIVETPHFFKLESPGTDRITADRIDRVMLDRFKNEFVGELAIFSLTEYKYIFINENRLYWTDLTHWVNRVHSPLMEIGILMKDSNGIPKLFLYSSWESLSTSQRWLVDNMIRPNYTLPLELVLL